MRDPVLNAHEYTLRIQSISLLGSDVEGHCRLLTCTKAGTDLTVMTLLFV